MQIIAKIKDRFSLRKDSEHKQTLIRIVIVSLVVIYSLFNELEPQWYFSSLGVSILSLVLSFSFLTHIYFFPEIHPTRRVLGMIHDSLMITFYLFLSGEKAAIFLFVYPWITIGSGFRYGTRYMLYSAVLSGLGLFSLFYWAPYWRELSSIRIGLWLNFALVVGYTAYLLKELNKAKENLEKLATLDVLTGLANRRLFEERLGYSLLLNQRHEKIMACLYFDLDGFKKVNDQFGHNVGDELLKEVAKKVKTCVRESDVFARFGGDEFAIILTSLNTRQDAELVAKRIIRSIESLQDIGNARVNVSASLGCILIHPKLNYANLSIESVIKQADDCMYLSKKRQKGHFEIADFQ